MWFPAVLQEKSGCRRAGPSVRALPVVRCNAACDPARPDIDQCRLCHAVPGSGAGELWGVELLGPEEGTVIGYVLSFAAGAFLCIALSDLLPEIHFHSHDRGKLIVSLLVGISLAYVL
ncbi:MAG: hypothetical protein OXN90_08395 [Gemmatimonadota bacterium]|nr:hypothetical protein [Gemmatimonadota bacterium]